MKEEIYFLDESIYNQKIEEKIDHILALARDYGAVSRVSGVGFDVVFAYKQLEEAIRKAVV